MENFAGSHTEATSPIVLSVSPKKEDHRALKKLLIPWAGNVYQAEDPSSARRALEKEGIGVVLCERDLSPGSWIDVLAILQNLRNAPPLIVTSRLADDSLWAEALNLGAYDVLATPFDRQELLRTVNLAWLRWRHQQETPLTATRVRTASAR